MRIPLWQISAVSLALAGSFTEVCLHHSAQTAHAAEGKERAPHTTWRAYQGGPDSAQYSDLRQINKSNVAQLQQVWFYPAGNNGFRYGSNPIIIDNVMYVIGKDNDIAAVDAATGKEIWVHDNHKPRNVSNRGVSYWESKDRSDRRILFSADNMLHEIDAKTGNSIDSFGNHGAVDLREGLGRVPSSIRQIQTATPGRVFENLLILGSATGEEYESPPGDLRAFDILTGKVAWSFHTVPHPGEMGYETWPKDAWKYVGGTNTWGEITIDEKTGIAYFPIGAPTYDFYGADRLGANLFSDCLLALDARTGKYLWHFQTTHHDLWDYDLMTAPKLMTIKHNGKMVDVVAQAGKNGFVYVFDRATGKPVFPIEERPVPQSDMPGEKSWPTQPIPSLPPFARQKFSAEDVDPYISNPAEREKIKAAVLAARNEGIYTPPTLGTTMETPGNNGGANWGTAAIDPATATFYVASKDAPSLLKLETKPPRRQMTGPAESQGHLVYIQNCQSCHTESRAGQPPAIPSLVNIIQRAGAERVATAVQNGLPPMPAFPDLDSDDVKNLIAYLKAPELGAIPGDIMARMMAPAPKAQVKLGPGGQRYWTGYGYMNSSEGLPAIGPPWSSLTAYDMNKGTIKWQIPLGEVEELVAKGIRNTGSYWPRGGPVVTAGGLIIAPTISDNTLHFYDKDTGKQVWSLHLPAGPEGIPAVYEVAGREYIAISARPRLETVRQPDGKATPAAATPYDNTKQGYYVFALPERSGK
ncbi:PQQ-binding-like beta-propeller repeat protein [Granulicella sp. WH15]|uniref:outer membrane protein assembly factor BamB family protein n=1 Tax=Granulicella sp. WH15 TaxID=2602070 RepID=UPI001366C5B7|nr:PQQ-binding-like beta-propeller repeat protein [Granulicella sp. WH15]QHN04205.1 PQQ-binding-like beta-propeller repeat protein [Granulicella sp. WH15]